MKILPIECKRYGYNYKQLLRQLDVVLYKKTDPETDQLISFEVFLVKEYPETTILGFKIEAGEQFAGSDYEYLWDFGIGKGTIKQAYDKAMHKFNELLTREKISFGE